VGSTEIGAGNPYPSATSRGRRPTGQLGPDRPAYAGQKKRGRRVRLCRGEPHGDPCVDPAGRGFFGFFRLPLGRFVTHAEGQRGFARCMGPLTVLAISPFGLRAAIGRLHTHGLPSRAKVHGTRCCRNDRRARRAQAVGARFHGLGHSVWPRTAFSGVGRPTVFRTGCVPTHWCFTAKTRARRWGRPNRVASVDVVEQREGGLPKGGWEGESPS